MEENQVCCIFLDDMVVKFIVMATEACCYEGDQSAGIWKEVDLLKIKELNMVDEALEVVGV